LPLLTRDSSLVVEAMKHAQSLFPWLLRGVDFDNDSAFNERRRRPMVPPTEARGDTLACLQEVTIRRSSSRRMVPSCAA
jgi:hypothetical protein